jgi:hypothetical protein
MRDDPMDAPLPDEIKPHTSYYEESAAKHEARLKELQALTPAQAEGEAQMAYEKEMASHRKWMADRALEVSRLTSMLTKVRAWHPPTPDHDRMKEFMVEQLTISLPGEWSPPTPVNLDGESWRQREIDKSENALAWDRKHLAEEIERAKGRDGWLKALRQSLAA